MSQTHELPHGDELPADGHPLQSATAALLEHVDPRWVQVAERVVTRTFSASRRSRPVRTEHGFGGDDDQGSIFVSEHVLRSCIRDGMTAVRGAAPMAIHLDSDREFRCTAVAIEIVVQFGQPILPVADEIRVRTEQVLTNILGRVPLVLVEAVHVHVGDVTVADPWTGKSAPV